MKITEQQLKQAIKEEITNILDEGFGDRFKQHLQARKKSPKRSEDDVAALKALRQMRGRGMEEPENVSVDKDYADRFSSAKKRKLEEDVPEEEYTTMMPPKPVDPEGVAGSDVPMTALSDGFEAARGAVQAMYSPTDRRYINAMMVIDMAEEQGGLQEGDMSATEEQNMRTHT
jgi:hypothetical protein